MLRESRELMRAISEALEGMDELGALDLEEASRLNEQLTTALTEVNGRLHLASEWLRKGYRSLAVEECERKPPLLDLVAVFDQPELLRWRELIDSCGFSPPPKLATDLAAELADAYAAEQAIAPLLRKFRLQNLERAPLKERLATLRRLCERDPETIEFRVDLEQFEQERLSEIEQEIADAVRTRNVELLRSLEKELCEQPWSIRKVRQLQELVRSRLRRLEVEQASEKLAHLTMGLQRACQEGDLHRARTLATRWHQLAELVRLETGHPLREQVQGALDWLMVQEQLHQVEAALNHGASPEELQRLVQRVTRLGHQLPSTLRRRLQSYLVRYERQERARRNRRALVALAIILGLLGLIGALGRLFVRQYQINEAYRVMRSLHVQDQWESVIERGRRFRARHGELPEKLAALVAEAEAKLRQEKELVEEFARKRRRVEQLLAQGTWEAILTAEAELPGLWDVANRVQRPATRDRLIRQYDALRRRIGLRKSQMTESQPR